MIEFILKLFFGALVVAIGVFVLMGWLFLSYQAAAFVERKLGFWFAIFTGIFVAIGIPYGLTFALDIEPK